MNSLAAAGSTKQEEKQLCPPGAGWASPGSWKELGSLPRTSQLARIKRSGDNFPGVQLPTPLTWADNTLSPTAASQESTNPKEELHSPCLFLTPFWVNSPGSKYPSRRINMGQDVI